MAEDLKAVTEAALASAGVTGPLVLGVSGGMDSVVLAHLLREIAPGRSITLHIAHFDHALRAASAVDARFVDVLAAAWGLPCHSARWAHGGLFPGGVEAAARAARYAFLAGVARSVAVEGGAPCIATAHHAHDQAETLLLNLIRGSGVRGLAAMRPLSFWREGAGAPVAILRPLLHMPRHAILSYAQAHGLTWCDDESNDDTTRTRNLVRREVLPILTRANPAVVETLGRTAALLAVEADRLDALDARLLARVTVSAESSERLLLRYGALRAFSAADRCAALRFALRSHFAPHDVSLRQIESLSSAVERPPHASGPHAIGAGIAWSVVHNEGGDLLSIHRAGALPLQPEGPWLDAAWRKEQGALALEVMKPLSLPDGWTLAAEHTPRPAAHEDARPSMWELRLEPAAGEGIRLTTPRPGLRMAPQGMRGHTRALGDIFTDRKVAPALRVGWPVIVAADGRVLWLCGILAAEGVVAAQGAPALHLHWRKAHDEAHP